MMESEPLSSKDVLPELGFGAKRATVPMHFTEVFQRQAIRHAERTALICGDESITYRELARLGETVARRLETNGVEPGARVAFLLDPSIGLIGVMLGVLMHGCAYVPISNKEAGPRVRAIVGDSGAAILLSESRYGYKLTEPGARTVMIDDWAIEGWPARDRASAGAATIGDTEADAYVIYTSGTTGKPKGVPITHRAMVHFGRSIVRLYGMTPEDVVLFFASPSFDVSVEELLLALMAGGTLCVAREEERHDPQRLQSLLLTRRVTAAILPLKVASALAPEGFPDLRLVVFGGEAVNADIVNRWQAPGRRVYNGYGPTETTIAVTQMECRGHFDEPPPIGRPMENHVVALLHEVTRAPVGPGRIGEIAIAGPGVTKGYLNQPTLNAERFIELKVRHAGEKRHERFYLTGDLGRWNGEGLLEYCGRRDQQIKIDGHRVEIAEIESVLSQHPHVEVPVVTLRDTGGRKELVAYVKPRVGGADIGGIRQFLKHRLPYYMVPRVLVVVDDFVLTPSGKIDRAALPSPESVEAARLSRFEQASLTPILARTREIFARTLGIDVRDVGDETDYFESGGDSLGAVTLAEEIGEAFSCDFSLIELLDHPTPVQIGRIVAERGGNEKVV